MSREGRVRRQASYLSQVRNLSDVSVAVLSTYAGPLPPLEPAVDGDVGRDLYATEDVTIPAGTWALVPTGIVIAMHPGQEAQVRPRSGNALKRGLTVLNSPGTIDPGFRGEVKVIVYNANQPVTVTEVVKAIRGMMTTARLLELEESRAVHIKRGDKIAQLVFNRVEHPAINVASSVEDLPSSVRGERGFGSTSTEDQS